MNYHKMIDHTLLKPDATKAMIDKLIAEAIVHDFATVCVNPIWVSYCAKRLKDHNVKVTTVIGFPLGANTIKIKVLEAREAFENGADEIDMVINIGALKDKNYELVLNEIKAVVEEAKGRLVKVILETCLLTKEEIVVACNLAKMAKANYVKTSTGFSLAGAQEADVALMKETVGNQLGVKASGGIRTIADFEKMLRAGATRIGTSNGCSLVSKS